MSKSIIETFELFWKYNWLLVSFIEEKSISWLPVRPRFILTGIDGLIISTLDINNPNNTNKIGHKTSIKNPFISLLVIKYLLFKQILKSILNFSLGE